MEISYKIIEPLVIPRLTFGFGAGQLQGAMNGIVARDKKAMIATYQWMNVKPAAGHCSGEETALLEVSFPTSSEESTLVLGRLSRTDLGKELP